VKKGSLEVNKGKIDKNVGIRNRQHGLIVAHILLQMVLHFLKYISKKKKMTVWERFQQDLDLEKNCERSL
jgi:hypothetical protein